MNIPLLNPPSSTQNTKITQTMKLSFPFSLSIFFFFFFLQITLVLSATILPFQLLSLLSLKTSLRDPLSSLHDWNPSLTFSKSDFQDPVWCTWSGIKCHPDTAQITNLDLSHRNLSGIIPPEIKYLSNLLHLNLSGNNFNGPLQAAIFELSELRTLDISHNNFNSTFPPGISKLKFLRIFSGYSNSFIGPLPEELGRLQYLEQLNLGGSFFDGAVPTTYGQFPRLKFMCLAGNLLQGSIPPQLGYLSRLERMEIGYNSFSAFIPSEFSSLVMLKYLDIASANLSGNLPHDLGNLTSLETLLLFRNQITGEIPESFSNLKALKVLDLSDNQLSGAISEQLGNLKELTQLRLMDNHLSGEISQAFAELPNLDTLFLWNNSLTGILPQTLGTNNKLQKLDVSSNFLTGPIPLGLCNGNKLFKLILFSNKFVNGLPVSLANCCSLSRFRVQDNQLNGSIPSGFGLLPNLTFVDMSSNNFSGEIPQDFSNAVKLEYLNISNNSFNTSLPENIWNSSSLQIFSASSAQITGKIPDFIGCKSVYKIELQDNFLNSSVPWTICNCEKLLSINLSRNSLSGIIPWEISTLSFITAVDLSHNFLTGSIPSNFQNCSTLETFNVSYNMLTGPIPSSGLVFPNLHPSSFFGNEGLCGVVLAKPCGTPIADRAIKVRPSQPHRTAGAIMWIMAAAFGIGLFLLVAGTRCFQANYSHRFRSNQETGSWKITAFQRLNFTADDVLECLSTTDRIIGMGSTGTVYKAEMPSGEIIAVKKLWGKNKDHIIRQRGALVEVDVLGNVRHRNIVRLLGCCSNVDCTMLLYEYMPNGNLEDLLHGKNKGENLTADWVTRYKIALGVAQGMCYLHHDCDPVIVHRDLKPSNILLDGEMEARVADFGVAKLIERHESMSVIAGSYGYIAPEYAYTLQVDEKSDIYSYGVVLLEILSGKRSVDSEFGDGNSIVDWVRSKIKVKDGIIGILDKNAGASCSSVREEMIQMLRIALLCTSRNPGDRPSMRDVVLMLQEAKPKRKLPECVVATGNACGGGRESGVSGRRGSSDGDILLTQKPALEC